MQQYIQLNIIKMLACGDNVEGECSDVESGRFARQTSQFRPSSVATVCHLSTLDQILPSAGRD